MKKIIIPIVVGVVLVIGVIFVLVGNKGGKNIVGKEFYDSDIYTGIINNKKDIVNVIKSVESEGEVSSVDVDVDEAYNKIKNMKIVKKTNISVLDSSSSYLFEFKDGTSISIYFEGKYLHFDGKNYEVEYKK